MLKNFLEHNFFINIAVYPKCISPFFFIRYGKGMFYGSHTDNVFTESQ